MTKQSLRDKRLKNRSARLGAGFTLIEVLVVVSIIGLLSAIILVGLSGFRARGRDTRRIADLKQVQNGLELFYAKNGNYPASLSDMLTANIGVTQLPKDPSTTQDYFYSYQTSDKQGYVLAAKLDASSGDAIFNDSATSVTIGNYTGSVTSCAQPYYCVTF
ncbi:MAG: prepilin-type N-terminal cleavage/methylation domain-containing protein [Patescibacteria group bacterium]|nr:prepilin-type N-terminal cleavage/methylation domain-containing protein [Patescibacteria group bacterium]